MAWLSSLCQSLSRAVIKKSAGTSIIARCHWRGGATPPSSFTGLLARLGSLKPVELLPSVPGQVGFMSRGGLLCASQEGNRVKTEQGTSQVTSHHSCHILCSLDASHSRKGFHTEQN